MGRESGGPAFHWRRPVTCSHRAVQPELWLRGLHRGAPSGRRRRGPSAVPPVPGEVLRFVEEIGKKPEARFILIDEMNRANLSRVFGELMYLFEYRDEADRPAVHARLRAAGEPAVHRHDEHRRSKHPQHRHRPATALRRLRAPARPQRSSSGSTQDRERRITCRASSTASRRSTSELTSRIDRHHTIGHAFFMAQDDDRRQAPRASGAARSAR